MATKYTQESYDSKLLELGLTYKRIGLFIDRLTPILHRCLICNTETLKPPKKVLAGVGCKTCATKKLTWTNEEYDCRIEASTFIRIDDYINNLVEILHKCKKCGIDYKVRPASILQGHGCKYCTNKVLKTTSTYRKELPSNISCTEEYKGNKSGISHSCNICNHSWVATPNNILSKHSGCPECAKYSSISRGEKELLEFIRLHYTGWIVENDRSILGGKELDIVLPDLGLAFEYNGVYWHSEEFVDKNFHLNKTLGVESIDYKLIHIFEDTWTNKNDIVKSRILSLLGKTTRIFARNCSVVELEDCSSFLENNHMQGNAPSSIKLGLVFNNNLVAVMTFGRPRFNSAYEYELIRYCSVLNTSIVGGASKLLKYFRSKYSGSIISYGNRAWGTPTLYKNLGFNLVGYSEPNYRYYKGRNSLSRYQCQKHKLIEQGYPSNMSEVEIMSSRGYRKVYDCGNSIWEFVNENALQ